MRDRQSSWWHFSRYVASKLIGAQLFGRCRVRKGGKVLPERRCLLEKDRLVLLVVLLRQTSR